MSRQLFSFAIAMIFAPALLFSQFNKVVVEEVDNEGKVSGRTYRVYAEMKNVKDQVYVIFGDSVHPLFVKSTKPFFQAKEGGAFAKDSNRKMIEERKHLKYDSWVTIGADDNYENNTAVLNVNFDEFEKGGELKIGKDGAWFCLPTDKQAWCKEDKRILLMQLTTQGEITGQFSIMGMSASGASYTVNDVTFTCGKKK